MKDIRFLDELEKSFNNLEKELYTDNKPHKEDPAVKELVKKIDEAIDEFHKPELELIEP